MQYFVGARRRRALTFIPLPHSGMGFLPILLPNPSSSDGGGAGGGGGRTSIFLTISNLISDIVEPPQCFNLWARFPVVGFDYFCHDFGKILFDNDCQRLYNDIDIFTPLCAKVGFACRAPGNPGLATEG